MLRLALQTNQVCQTLLSSSNRCLHYRCAGVRNDRPDHEGEGLRCLPGHLQQIRFHHLLPANRGYCPVRDGKLSFGCSLRLQTTWHVRLFLLDSRMWNCSQVSYTVAVGGLIVFGAASILHARSTAPVSHDSSLALSSIRRDQVRVSMFRFCIHLLVRDHMSCVMRSSLLAKDLPLGPSYCVLSQKQPVKISQPWPRSMSLPLSVALRATRLTRPVFHPTRLPEPAQIYHSNFHTLLCPCSP